jgi:hypothetical protein
MSLFGRSTVALAAGAALLATLTAAPRAQAEGQVSPKGKGIVGGALLGAEVVDLGLAIGGVEKGWPYIVFGAVGAAGGGVGGYFVEKAVGTDGPAEAPVFMLAGGLALVIPTLVASLNATAFRPADVERDGAPVQPAPEAPAPRTGVGATVSQAAPVAPVAPAAVAPAPPRFAIAAPPPPPRIPMSLLDLHEGHVALGLPAVQVRPLYSQKEIATYGVDQKSEVRVPVFQAVF